MKDILKNKKGQVASVIVAVVTIFVIGVILLFFNHMNKQIYGSLEEYLEENYNNTEAHKTAQELENIEDSKIWDYVFIAVYIGTLISMALLSFATRINIGFFWIFVIFAIIILVVGTMLSNIWQEVAADTEFSETITRFPITNTLLGTYYPSIVTGIIFFMMIFLFGKPPNREI